MFSRRNLKFVEKRNRWLVPNDRFRIFTLHKEAKYLPTNPPSKMINDGAKSDRGIRSTLS